jgi:hypothetical protein
MKPKILCDIDGVALNWLSKLPEYLLKYGIDHEKAIFAYANNEFLSHSEITGLPEHEATKVVLDYNESEYIKYLTPYKDALSVINLLKHEFDFVAVTAIGRAGKSSQYRMENLNFWYPNAFTDIHVVNMNESKLSVLSKYNRTFFIDDSPNYCAEGKQSGHTSIRIVRDSRVDITNTIRCNNFFEIGSFIETQNHFKK